MAQLTKTLYIYGMTCRSCENRIEKKLKGMNGISKARASYADGTVQLAYDSDAVSLDKIIQAVESLGYKAATTRQGLNAASKIIKAVGTGVIILAVYTFLNYFGFLNFFNMFPQAEEGMGYGMLFVIGLLTSVHCIAMCGGINLSQCISPAAENTGGGQLSNFRSSFLYNFGRVVSYTLIGGIVGGVGDLFGFSGSAKGIVQLAAGVFMVIMGLNMLGLLPFLRRLNLKIPSLRNTSNKKNSNSPLYVGLLNGLMPCGPLQAMQLYALSTCSVTRGAFSMLLFSLGTVPLMFGLGALSSILTKKFTGRMMTAGAVLVIILGMSMFSGGMSLSGATIAVSQTDAAGAAIEIVDGVQYVTTQLYPNRYESITVKAGVPVRWNITADQKSINGCNNAIIIPEYDIVKGFEIGDNIIEFTPDKTGVFPYSCWMGMMRASITVVD